MKGHLPLIAMRRNGYAPGAVFVDVDYPDPGPTLWPIETPWRAHIAVLKAEPLSGLDWRCCTGMLVLVQGEDAERTHAVAAAIQEAGAMRVLCAVVAGDVTLTETTCDQAT